MLNLYAFLRNYFRPPPSPDAAAIKAANDKAMADELAARTAYNNDDYVRLNYYQKADFARYQDALAARVAGPDGIKPWINIDDFKTAPPPVIEWATWSPEKKALGHVDL